MERFTATAKRSSATVALNIVLMVAILGYLGLDANSFAAGVAGTAAARFPAAARPVKIYPVWPSTPLFNAGAGQGQLQLGEHRFTGFIARLNQLFASGKISA